MAKIKGAIVVDIERCKGCGLCVANCPTQCLALKQDDIKLTFQRLDLMADGTGGYVQFRGGHFETEVSCGGFKGS